MKIREKIFAIILIFFISLQTVSLASEIDLNSKSAIIVEVSTGRIIYEKASTAQMYPASTTKIMTAILVLENANLADIVTVSATAVDIPSGYVTCDLQEGEEIAVKDLLYALMLPSANDAAYALAEHVGGNVDSFADMMNVKAKEIGCMGTHFVNPNGIHDDRHYSTAYDMYLIAKYAMENETFRQIVSTVSYVLPATNKYPNADRVLETTNDLINPEKSKYYYKNAIGIKTGYTSNAGSCLVAESSRDGLDFISVVLGGTSEQGIRFLDTKKLFDYGYDNYTLTKIREKNTVVDTIEIENATDETKNLDLLISDSITIINNKSLNVDQIIPEITLNENIMAPIVAGQELGTIEYKVDDIEYSAKLLASTDVEEKKYTNFIIFTAIIMLLVGISLLKKNKKKQKRKKRRTNMYV